MGRDKSPHPVEGNPVVFTRGCGVIEKRQPPLFAEEGRRRASPSSGAQKHLAVATAGLFYLNMHFIARTGRPFPRKAWADIAHCLRDTREFLYEPRLCRIEFIAKLLGVHFPDFE
jgi:hypothetical protein